MTDARRLLVLNTGSSSVKAAAYQVAASGELDRGVSGALDRLGASGGVLDVEDRNGQTLHSREMTATVGVEAGVTAVIEAMLAHSDGEPVAVGHRIVHGGARFVTPTVLDDAVVAALGELRPLAPEHLPTALAAIAAARQALPDAVHVGAFDTAFHRSIPDAARTYPLSARARDAGVVRYGFHGLSCEYLVEELARVEPDARRVVICHLGNGASMTAVRDGRSVDTTMGFTPAGGLVMGTRSGDLDPGVVTYLQEQLGLGPAETSRLVNHESGMLGISGRSADVRDLLAAAGGDPPDDAARLALDVFVHAARKHLAGLAAVLGGVDAVVFTGGIGEHAAEVRARVCDGLDFAGIRLDQRRNARPDPVVSPSGAAVTVRVIPTDESLVIARHTNSVLDGRTAW